MRGMKNVPDFPVYISSLGIPSGISPNLPITVISRLTPVDESKLIQRLGSVHKPGGRTVTCTTVYVYIQRLLEAIQNKREGKRGRV